MWLQRRITERETASLTSTAQMGGPQAVVGGVCVWALRRHTATPYPSVLPNVATQLCGDVSV